MSAARGEALHDAVGSALWWAFCWLLLISMKPLRRFDTGSRSDAEPCG